MSSVKEKVTREALYGTLPVMRGEKTFGFWDFFLVVAGYGIATWCFTQGAYTASLTGFAEMTVSVLAGNLLFIVIIALAIPPVVRYGVDLWVSLRALYGYRGIRVIAVLLVIVNFPWYAVAAGIFSSSLIRLIEGFGVTVPEIFHPVLAVLCVLGGTLIALGGPIAIKWSNRITVPLLIIVAIVIICIALGAVPFDAIAAYKPEGGDSPANFAFSIEASIAFAMSWVAALGVMPRLARRESHTVAGTVLAYGLVVPLFVLTGGIMAIAMFLQFGVMSDDMTEMLIAMGSPVVALLALIGVGVANITTQSIGSYSYSIALKSAFPKADYRVLVWILAAYTAILAVWGGATEYFGAFLSIAGLVYAPFIGLMLTDFYVVRRGRFSLRSIYRIDGNTAYQYTGGFNLLAFFSMIAGAVISLLVMNPVTGEIGSDVFYILGSSAFACLSTAVIYGVLGQIPMFKHYLLKDRDALTP
ncbi:purine-cytosine permease family protein [Microbacterium sp. NPDC055357]